MWFNSKESFKMEILFQEVLPRPLAIQTTYLGFFLQSDQPLQETYDSTCITCGSFEKTNYKIHTCSSCGTDFLNRVGGVEDQAIARIKTQFDDGNLTYIVQTIRYDLIEIDLKKYAPKINLFKLTIKPNGKMVISKNGKIVFNRVEQILTILRNEFKELLGLSVHAFRMANNHRLKDLITEEQVDSFYGIINENIRRKVYYHYDKYGVKRSREALLDFKGNKQLVNFCWTEIWQSQTINDLLKTGLVADQVSQLLPFYENNRNIFAICSALFSFGFSYKRIVNFCKKDKDLNIVFDCSRMVSYLGDNYTPNLNVTSLKQFHDNLIVDFQRYMKKDLLEVALPEQSIKDSVHYGLNIVSPTVGLDLVDCGAKMHICVGSYVHDVRDKKVEVYLGKINNEDVVCISVVNGNLSQAKLKYNNHATKDEYLLKSVLSWCKENKVNYSNCYDVIVQDKE